jgi:hypothetical protein
MVAMSTVAIQQYWVHADGRTTGYIPPQVVADEYAVGRPSLEAIGSAVEDLCGGLPPSDIAAQHDGIDSL